jgi:signal transduction histidine kinase
MYNKNGIPFFIIILPFFILLLTLFLQSSYHLKMTNEMVDSIGFISPQYQSQLLHVKSEFQDNYLSFTLTVGLVMLLFSALFAWLMNTIVNITIKEYKEEVRNREDSLERLNISLHERVKKGIEEGLEKDKAILRQSRLARLGSMLSMIAHQWRQPLSELSATLMEMEMASRFQKLSSQKVQTSLARCNDRIEYMSQTIDDFRNFYKPDKEKSLFFIQEACSKALNLSNAALKNAQIKVKLLLKDNVQIWGYPTEFAQALLSIITNAKDVFEERKIAHPLLTITIASAEFGDFISIEDNGGGINNGAIEYLFDPYFSTKRSAKGTGMGLYIAKIIVEEKMGGEIKVNNTQSGAQFLILFKKENTNA